MTAKRIELPPKLVPIFAPARGELRYRGAYGGRGSGKSFTFAKMAAIWGAIEPLRILCTREMQNSIKQSFHAELKSAIASDAWLSSVYDVGVDYLRGHNGTEFMFYGLRTNIGSIKSMAQIDLCIVEEAEDVPERSWLDLEPTIRAPKSEIWVIWNPKQKKSPVDIRLRRNPPPRSMVAEVNYTDNPWFPEELDEQRQHAKETMAEAMYRHIWEGDYLDIQQGAYWADLLTKAEKDKRITHVPYDPATAVNTFWDLGMNDQTTIWFHQQVGQEHHFIDYYSNEGEGFAHYAKTLKELPYVYGTHYLPHDAEVRELATGKHRREVLEGLGVKPIEVVKRINHINEGIEMARQVIPLCWFDEEKCATGIDCLQNYRREFDENLNTFKPRPLHDWASHGADAFRQFAQGYRGANTGWAGVSKAASVRRGKKAVQLNNDASWMV